MNIQLSENLPSDARPEFELNQRVTHPTHGDGTVRGMVYQGNGVRLWLVQFDSMLTPGRAALSVPELYAAPGDSLQAIAL